MTITPDSPHRPYEDAISVFENGHLLINAYREKYGFSYRHTIRTALKRCHKAQVRKEERAKS